MGSLRLPPTLSLLIWLLLVELAGVSDSALLALATSSVLDWNLERSLSLPWSDIHLACGRDSLDIVGQSLAYVLMRAFWARAIYSAGTMLSLAAVFIVTSDLPNRIGLHWNFVLLISRGRVIDQDFAHRWLRIVLAELLSVAGTMRTISKHSIGPTGSAYSGASDSLPP